jgi:phosphoribulokinase
MSVKHPIIAVTGSSGAGTTTVCSAFAKVFQREKIIPFFIEGNSFRRYNREKMREVVAESIQRGRRLSHFGPEVNLFDRMEGVFQEYSRTGSCLCRKYAENLELAEALGVPVGTFTPWKEIPDGSDLLFYEGMHGGVTWESWSRRNMSPSHNPFVVKVRQQMMERADYGIDVARWVDLLIGVVPAINLEWIQKIHRDTTEKGGTQEAVAHAIMRRLPDYIKYITPQFSLTDINFQRVPLVDTSNPFIARDIPCLDESIIVIRFREPKKFDFPDLLNKLDGSFMSRSNTLVVPGSSMEHAMEVICTPMVHRLVEMKRTDKK